VNTISKAAWVNTGGNLGTVKTRLRALRLEVLHGAEWQLGAEAGVSHQQFQRGAKHSVLRMSEYVSVIDFSCFRAESLGNFFKPTGCRA